MAVTNPTTLDEIYNYITTVYLGGAAGDITLGKLLLAMGAAIRNGNQGPRSLPPPEYRRRTGQHHGGHHLRTR